MYYSPAGRPRFDMVTATVDADERRFVSLDVVRSLSGITTAQLDDTALGLRIDAVLASCARSCRLASVTGYPLTLARETVKATWTAQYWDWYVRAYPAMGQPFSLLLPWRAPITDITVTEGETELVQDTDYELLGAGVVQRINSAFWPTSGVIAVEYTAGWLQDDDVFPPPDDLVALIADQVRLVYSQSGIDPALRSEDIPGIWSGTYNVPGGDVIDTSGLLRPLWDALAPFRAPPSFG